MKFVFSSLHLLTMGVFLAVPPLVHANARQVSVEDAPGASQPDGPLAKARQMLGRDKLDDAESATREFLKTDPTSGEGHYLLAYILFRQAQAMARATAPARYASPSDPTGKPWAGKARASLAEYKLAATYRNPSAFDLKGLALDYVCLRDYGDADKSLTLAVKWNPQDAQGWYYLGRTKYNEKRFKEAIQAFQQCLVLDPPNADAEDNLGLSYAALGRADVAAAAYHRAIDWQESKPEKVSGPLLNLGSLLLQENRVEEAIPYLRRAVEISPNEAEIHEKLGKALLQANQLRKAETELQRAVELAPESARLHYNLGRVYQKEGLAGKAKEQLDQCAVQASWP